MKAWAPSTLVCLAILIWSSVGMAQSYGKCANPKTTTEAVSCLTSSEGQAQKSLIEKRQAILNIFKSSPEQQKKFQEAESAWDQSLNILCDQLIDNFYNGGTIRVPNVLACRYDATQTHEEFLTRLFRVQLPR